LIISLQDSIGIIYLNMNNGKDTSSIRRTMLPDIQEHIQRQSLETFSSLQLSVTDNADHQHQATGCTITSQ